MRSDFQSSREYRVFLILPLLPDPFWPGVVVLKTYIPYTHIYIIYIQRCVHVHIRIHTQIHTHTHTHTCVYIFTNPYAWVRCDTRSVTKLSSTSLNSESTFSSTGCQTKAKEYSLSYYLPIAWGRIVGFMPFPRISALCKIQTASFKIWTWVAMTIFYDYNQYNTGTSNVYIYIYILFCQTKER